MTYAANFGDGTLARDPFLAAHGAAPQLLGMHREERVRHEPV